MRMHVVQMNNTIQTSNRVLTMERLNGVALTDLDAIRSTTRANPEQTLINALNTWFGSLLGCETFHADVHAGGHLVQGQPLYPGSSTPI